jgi:hypothetical protein
MAYFISAQGGYYEGDRAHQLDQAVPQRPSPYSTWDGAQWVTPDAATIADIKAQAFADAVERVQFRMLFNLNNRVLVLEAKPQLTVPQFKQQVVDLWKQLNA